MKLMPELPELKEAKVLSVKEGDIVVLEYPERMTEEQVDAVLACESEFAPAKLIILAGGIRLSGVVRNEEEIDA